MRMRLTVILALWLLIGIGGAWAQEGGGPSPAGGGAGGGAAAALSRGSLLLLQSEVAGQIRDGTAFVVKGGPASLALTSYDAVKGAATIHALVPQHGLVMARLLKFAPEANLALLELAIPDLPALRIGDSDLVRADEPVEMVTASAMREGSIANAMSPITRKGQVAAILSRPGGTLLQLKFDGAIADESTGAPVLSQNSGDVIAIALPRNSAGNDAARMAVPANLAGALAADLAKASGATASVRVLDGSQAPVEAGSGEAAAAQGGGWIGYAVAIGGALVVVGAIAVVVLRRKEQMVPFSILPKLPEGVTMAFVDANGNLLPMDRDPIRIGRAAENDWSFNDASVSNYHARIKKIKGGTGYEVEDMRSTNGTFVRDRQIGGAETITPGSKIRFGKIEVMLMTRSQSNG